MTKELVAKQYGKIAQRKNWRRNIPQDHRASIDTRIRWLWNQRFGTVQTVWQHSDDALDRTAATLLLQAIMERDLESIDLIFQRLEGGPMMDEEMLERKQTIRV